MDEQPMMAGETSPPAEPSPEKSVKTSVFIPKDALGGRSVNVGDSLDFLTVKDVDPDTGEVEAGCEEPKESMPSTSEAIDEMED